MSNTVTILHKPTGKIFKLKAAIWEFKASGFMYLPQVGTFVPTKTQRELPYYSKEDCVVIPEGLELDAAETLFKSET